MSEEPLLFKSRGWWKCGWDVYQGTEILGSLTILKKMSYALAEATVGKEHWQIGYSGWSQSRMFVKDETGKSIGETTLRSKWGSQVDLMLRGKKYSIKSSGWSSTRYVVQDENGADVLNLQLKYWKASAVVTFVDTNFDEPTFLLLALITFYRAKLVEMQTAAVTTAVTAVAVVPN